jgi:hypothetical protein
MKTTTISNESAKRIKELNNEYLTWADGSEITSKDIINKFYILKYPNGTENLIHRFEDFRIEDILTK